MRYQSCQISHIFVNSLLSEREARTVEQFPRCIGVSMGRKRYRRDCTEAGSLPKAVGDKHIGVTTVLNSFIEEV